MLEYNVNDGRRINLEGRPMRFLIPLTLALILGLVACSAPSNRGADEPVGSNGSVQGNQDEPYVLPFEFGNGRVIVVPGDNMVQFIVSVKGLANQEYEVAFAEGGNSGGVIFGEGNALLKYGELHGNTTVLPVHGTILMWSIQPERVVVAAQGGSIVVREASGERREVARSLPMQVTE